MDPSDSSILASDFNLVFDRAIDRQGSCFDNDSRESSVALVRPFTHCCCVDAWRHLFPSQPGFTRTRSDGVMSSRIELIGCATIWAPFILFVISCPAPLLIIAVCVSWYLCLTPSLLVLACGSLMSRFWRKMLIASWLRIFGLTRGIADPVFHQSWTDGSWESRKGRESR